MAEDLITEAVAEIIIMITVCLKDGFVIVNKEIQSGKIIEDFFFEFPNPRRKDYLLPK